MSHTSEQSSPLADQLPPGGPDEPHASGGVHARLNWLRAGVLGANDGIVSVAATVVGVFLREASLRPADGAPVLPVMTVRDAWRDSAYRASIAASDAHLRAAAGLDVLTAQPVAGEPRTLRWVIAHMTSETVRHAGHADILRELIDGVTGR